MMQRRTTTCMILPQIQGVVLGCLERFCQTRQNKVKIEAPRKYAGSSWNMARQCIVLVQVEGIET